MSSSRPLLPNFVKQFDSSARWPVPATSRLGFFACPSVSSVNSSSFLYVISSLSSLSSLHLSSSVVERRLSSSSENSGILTSLLLSPPPYPLSPPKTYESLAIATVVCVCGRKKRKRAVSRWTCVGLRWVERDGEKKSMQTGRIVMIFVAKQPSQKSHSAKKVPPPQKKVKIWWLPPTSPPNRQALRIGGFWGGISIVFLRSRRLSARYKTFFRGSVGGSGRQALVAGHVQREKYRS